MDPWSTEVTGVVELPDGRRVRGTGVRHRRDGAPEPTFGVYLLGKEPAEHPWEQRWVRWRDFRVPDSTDDTVEALREAYARAADERVEIACGGGIGRTGTAIAFLAVLAGTPVNEAPYWVRRAYHPRAIETPWQRRWIRTAAARL